MRKVLEVKNVGKSFRIYSSELKRVLSWFGLRFAPAEEHKILENINFSLSEGEAVGLVGHNGAGKSTLLKMIAGTLSPSFGSIDVDGRISAILELGMGFHPDLTGRQNVYHSAGLMGYTVQEIDHVIKDIEAFAEIGDYFDQPVRTYSSGMQMRVAFAVVTAYRPDILIVDEAFSVGDAYFQHKSLSRIREFQEQGTALLLVSHDKGAIQAICDRAILLEQGTILKDGPPEDIMDYYNALVAERESSKIEQVEVGDVIATSSGSKEAEFVEIKLYNSKGIEVDSIKVGEHVEVRLKVKINEDINSLVLGCGIKDKFGQMMFGTNTYHTQQILRKLKKGDTYLYSVKFVANLGVGSYSIHASLVEETSHIQKNFNWVDRAVVFSVVNVDKYEFVGCLWNEMKFDVERVKP